MGYPQTAVPETAHSVFYAYSIHVNGVALGSFDRFSARSTRTTERIREILLSRGPEVKEIVWGGTDTSIDLSYVELYTKSAYEALGYEIFALEDLNTPITITEIMTLPNSTGGYRIIDYVDGVVSDWGKEIDSGGTRITESITVQIRKVQGRRES